jgi:ornithine cyclodeaminase
MIYINERILRNLGIRWNDLIDVIRNATHSLKEKKTNQPIKPYLRYNNLTNRIIAMPAYVGGQINSAGIKWIASFPDNIKKNIKRAHAVIILNDTETGAPISVINTALISGIRTASVSGFVLQEYIKSNNPGAFNCGIIGFGPIGQLHLDMIFENFSDYVEKIFIYDKNPIDIDVLSRYNRHQNITVCNNWEDVYENTNLFITCTVSSDRYISKSPKKGGVYLNVSLRDFNPDFVSKTDRILVDNWEEICRENTDIERANLEFGLEKKDVAEITELLNSEFLSNLDKKSFMFNPMGMAIYDIAVAKYYYNLAKEKKQFIELED